MCVCVYTNADAQEFLGQNMKNCVCLLHEKKRTRLHLERNTKPKPITFGMAIAGEHRTTDAFLRLVLQNL